MGGKRKKIEKEFLLGFLGGGLENDGRSFLKRISESTYLNNPNPSGARPILSSTKSVVFQRIRLHVACGCHGHD